MKIIVIGSKGFIGSHSMKHFADAGHDVTGCDVSESDEKNYYCLLSSDYNFNKIFSQHKFDYCINAAGSAHVNYSFQYPEKDFELNVSLVINVLAAIKNHSPQCRFINFSSAAVYGNPASLPISESQETKPLSPYGYHKLLSEKLLNEYYKFFNVGSCSLRVFSAYGEGLKKQLFWDLYNKSLGAENVKLFGTGVESRDFIYISDLMEIIDVIIQKADFEGEVYNVGNGEEILIQDAVEIFFRELGWKGKVVFSGETKLGDPVNWKADISKIEKLGYQREISFSEGLRRYSKWLKDLK